MIVAGFGFRAAASAESLADALAAARGAVLIDAVAAPEDKCAAPAFRAFAQQLDLPVIAVSARDISATETPTQSRHVQQARATGVIAGFGVEGYALAMRRMVSLLT